MNSFFEIDQKELVAIFYMDEIKISETKNNRRGS